MKKVLVAVVFLFVIATAFLWFLYLGSSHNIPLTTHLGPVSTLAVLLAILISLTKTWRKLCDWFAVLVIEAIAIFAYKFYQLKCEPCLPNSDCPPCISSEQIILKYSGIIVLVVFLIWKVSVAYKMRSPTRDSHS